MSDYLSALAARSLESTAVIQPRLVSRFEPVLRGGSFVRTPDDLTADAVMDSVAEVPVRAMAPTGSVQRQPAVPAQLGQSSVALMATRLAQGETEAKTASPQSARDAKGPGLETIVTPGGQFASQSSSSQRTSHIDDVHGRIQNTSVRSTAVVAPARQPGAAGLDESRTSEPTRPPVGPLPSQDHLSLDDLIRPAIGAVQARGPGQLTADDRPTPPLEESGARVQPAVLVRAITQVQAAIAPPARPAWLDVAAAEKLKALQEPHPAPTIQVTIGRVEVRAASPPASSPAARQASPVMDLEAYLRQKTDRGNS